MKKHSDTNELRYLATIKRNHKIMTGLEHPHDTTFNWKYLRALKNARRLNGVPLVQVYSTAEHSYYVAILFDAMAKAHGITYTVNEMRFVLQHDVLEAVTGDVLLPVKIHSEETKKLWERIEELLTREAHPSLKDITDEAAETFFDPIVWKLFKACDLLELFLFCREEIEMGNTNDQVMAVFRNCANLLPEFGFEKITEIVEEQ